MLSHEEEVHLLSRVEIPRAPEGGRRSADVC